MANISRVLVIGLDPRAVGDLVVDADAVVAALAHGQARFDAAGIPAEVCLVGLDPVRATDQIVEQLCAQEYACVPAEDCLTRCARPLDMCGGMRCCLQ